MHICSGDQVQREKLPLKHTRETRPLMRAGRNGQVQQEEVAWEHTKEPASFSELPALAGGGDQKERSHGDAVYRQPPYQHHQLCT